MTNDAPGEKRMTTVLPTDITEHDKQTLPLPRVTFGATEDDDLFLMRPAGVPPAEMGIAASDWVIVRKQRTAEPGDVIAGLAGGDAVIRRFDGEPIVIVGTVLAIVRRVT
jgi:SOS-response transcriptional repressor LexA